MPAQDVGTCLFEDEQQDLVKHTAAGDLQGGLRLRLGVAVMACHTERFQQLSHGAHASFTLCCCTPLLHQVAGQLQGACSRRENGVTNAQRAESPHRVLHRLCGDSSGEEIHVRLIAQGIALSEARIILSSQLTTTEPSGCLPTRKQQGDQLPEGSAWSSIAPFSRSA